jgi:hypothetical protein
MNYTISPDNRTLTLTVSPEERAVLKEVADYNQKTGYPGFYDTDEQDALEGLIANSELDWINPVDTGDLTAAPLLGILGAVFSESGRDGVAFPSLFGWVHVGRYERRENNQEIPHNGEIEDHFQPILQRWGYSHYQIRSFLTDLMETGKAEFLNSW